MVQSSRACQPEARGGFRDLEGGRGSFYMGLALSKRPLSSAASLPAGVSAGITC